MNNLGMQTVTLRRVNIYKTGKDGQKMITKNGKPYVRVTINTDKHGENQLSGMIFDAKDARLQWKEGMQVEILVEQNGQYFNFRVPSGFDKLEARIAKLEAHVFTQTTTAPVEFEDPKDDMFPEETPDAQANDGLPF